HRRVGNCQATIQSPADACGAGTQRRRAVNARRSHVIAFPEGDSSAQPAFAPKSRLNKGDIPILPVRKIGMSPLLRGRGRSPGFAAGDQEAYCAVGGIPPLKLQGFGAAVAVILIVLTGCDRASKPEPSQPSVAKAPTIASLVPAATDLVRGMGAGEHLVAVSNYDQDAGGLPKVGDYQTIDWEKLAQIRPSCIVTQYGTGHNPPGFVERARELNIKQVNVRFDRLDDVFKMISVLGDACDESAAAAKESKEIRDALDEVYHRVEGLPPVRTIIVTGSSGMELAGTGTYLDDLLRQAGGDN